MHYSVNSPVMIDLSATQPQSSDLPVTSSQTVCQSSTGPATGLPLPRANFAGPAFRITSASSRVPTSCSIGDQVYVIYESEDETRSGVLECRWGVGPGLPPE